MSGSAFRSPGDLPAPAGYSHVASIPPGELVWTSGQVGIAADGSVAEGWEAQTRLAFENVGRALRAAGAGWGDVVKLLFFVVAVDELATVRRVRDEFVDTSAPPTSSLVQVAGLFRPDLLVEVEAVAAPRPVARRQTLRILDGRFVLEHAGDAVAEGELLALVRGPDGRTAVRRDDAAQAAWTALWNGDEAHDPQATGMLSAIVAPLAAAELPVWVASSFDGDLVLVPADRLAEAVRVLRDAGHHVVG